MGKQLHNYHGDWIIRLQTERNALKSQIAILVKALKFYAEGTANSECSSWPEDWDYKDYDDGSSGAIRIKFGTKASAALAEVAAKQPLKENQMNNPSKSSPESPAKEQPGEQNIEALYYELLYAVGNKYPGETRHQTALRYIRRAEEPSEVTSQVANVPPPPERP